MFHVDIYVHTCLSVNMSEGGLHPTLWRTCRTLADRTRLEIVRDLIKNPGRSVSEVATRHDISVPMASISLRALNARGILASCREGTSIFYSVSPNESISWTRQLTVAISKVFTHNRSPLDVLCRQATAFTHPRRITICRALIFKGRLSCKHLVFQSRISRPALRRHLIKLQKRGFVSLEKKLWRITTPSDDFSRALIKILSEPRYRLV